MLADTSHGKFKTLKKRIMRHQGEHGTSADYIILMRNNLQDPKYKNASPTAGKYMVFGEGPAKERFLNGDLLYNIEEMFLMASHKNNQEEVVSDREEEQEQDMDEDDDAEKEGQSNDHGAQQEGDILPEEEEEERREEERREEEKNQFPMKKWPRG